MHTLYILGRFTIFGRQVQYKFQTRNQKERGKNNHHYVVQIPHGSSFLTEQNQMLTSRMIVAQITMTTPYTSTRTIPCQRDEDTLSY